MIFVLRFKEDNLPKIFTIFTSANGEDKILFSVRIEIDFAQTNGQCPLKEMEIPGFMNPLSLANSETDSRLRGIISDRRRQLLVRRGGLSFWQFHPAPP